MKAELSIRSIPFVIISVVIYFIVGGCDQNDPPEVTGGSKHINLEEPHYREAVAGTAKQFQNSLGMNMILVPPKNEVATRREDADNDVDLIGGNGHVYLGASEVTHEQFQRFLDETSYSNASEWRAAGRKWVKDYMPHKEEFDFPDNWPAQFVSLRDADAFCNWLSKKEDRSYRLPTYREFRLVCRSMSSETTASGMASMSEYAWHAAPLEEFHPQPVGTLLPTEWGFYDILGNVWEWTATDPVDVQLECSSETAPCGTIYGGCYHSGAKTIKCDTLHTALADYRGSDLGFRVACDLRPDG